MINSNFIGSISLIGIVLIGIFVFFAASTSVTALAKKDFAVVGYLPEYRLNGFNYSAAFNTGLTHLIFFSIEVHGNGNLKALDRIPDKYKLQQAREAADKVGGKVGLGFGGNARSDGFGEMATSPVARAAFIENLRRMLEERPQFDCFFDLNWEYPRNDREWKAWAPLMSEIKKELGQHCIVTFTIYLDPNHYHLISKYKLVEAADYVLCMAYDQPRKHSTTEFMLSGIKYAKDYNIPLDKFVIGVPFYGRDQRTGDPKTYNELVPAIKSKYSSSDPNQKPFSKDPQDHDKYDVVGTQYFNSRATIAHKTKLALESGIGGVMIWELGQDKQPLSHKKSLMSALHSVLPPRHQHEQQNAGGNGDL